MFVTNFKSSESFLAFGLTARRKSRWISRWRYVKLNKVLNGRLDCSLQRIAWLFFWLTIVRCWSYLVRVKLRVFWEKKFTSIWKSVAASSISRSLKNWNIDKTFYRNFVSWNIQTLKCVTHCREPFKLNYCQKQMKILTFVKKHLKNTHKRDF